jgi:hypothetical protein
MENVARLSRLVGDSGGGLFHIPRWVERLGRLVDHDHSTLSNHLIRIGSIFSTRLLLLRPFVSGRPTSIGMLLFADDSSKRPSSCGSGSIASV